MHLLFQYKLSFIESLEIVLWDRIHVLIISAVLSASAYFNVAFYVDLKSVNWNPNSLIITISLRYAVCQSKRLSIMTKLKNGTHLYTCTVTQYNFHFEHSNHMPYYTHTNTTTIKSNITLTVLLNSLSQ